MTESQATEHYHQVKDGSRVLQFTGTPLARSSSYRSGSHRWVEFELYRTTSGSYVLGRTGVSTLYHDPACAVVARNDLKIGVPPNNGVPCEQCEPGLTGPVCVERNRHWAQVSESPNAVLDALYKYDDSGTRYLTIVAQRLIEDAIHRDEGLFKAYSVEYIA